MLARFRRWRRSVVAHFCETFAQSPDELSVHRLESRNPNTTGIGQSTPAQLPQKPLDKNRLLTRERRLRPGSSCTTPNTSEPATHQSTWLRLRSLSRAKRALPLNSGTQNTTEARLSVFQNRPSPAVSHTKSASGPVDDLKALCVLKSNLKLCASPRAVAALLEEVSEKIPLSTPILDVALYRLGELNCDSATIEDFCGALGLKCCAKQKLRKKKIRLFATESGDMFRWCHDARTCLLFEQPAAPGLARYFRKQPRHQFTIFFDGQDRLVHWSFPNTDNNSQYSASQ